MKKTDYQTILQAKEFQKKRFERGLSIVNQDELRILNNWLSKKIKPKSKFLDLGAGTGRIVGAVLKHQPQKIYALDNSDSMLKLLRQRFKEEISNQKIKLLLSSCEKIPLTTNSLDCVTAFHLIKHLPKIGPTLKETQRVLKPGGFFIFDVLNKKSIVRLNMPTCSALTKNQLQKKLKENGLKEIEIKYLHHCGETIYKIFGQRWGKVFQKIDQQLTRLNWPTGTKMLVLSQKK